jgi:hypothetical protein
VYELQINTWLFTIQTQQHRNPIPTLDDLKILVKAFSSHAVESRSDRSTVRRDGLAGDKKGFSSSILSPPFPLCTILFYSAIPF